MISKKLFTCAAFLALATLSFAQDAGDEDATMKNNATNRDQKAVEEARSGWWKKAMENKSQRLQWWREAKFGMFVHWGVYSEAGGEWKGKEVGGYAEHLMRKETISKKEYLELANKFNPLNFDAEKWIKTAKNAGMHYFVLTAKHHDGFAMYPSEYSDFDIADKTSFKRDPIAELAAACKKYGLKFGFYYSHAFDWEHPDAPGNDWEYNNPGGDRNLFGGRAWYNIHPELIPKAQKYVNEKAIPQLLELLKKYHPDLLWFDTPHKLPFSENLRILKAIIAVDQNVVVNGRLARTGESNFGDYSNTADRPAEFFPATGDWEAIPTTNESYGYNKYDNSHKPASHFIRLLANATSRGGNILMNIGPKGDGSFDVKDQRILDSMAVWMAKYQESIYKVTASPLPLQNWGAITKKEDLLFLHVFNWPSDNKLLIGGLKGGCRKVYIMGDKNKKSLTTSKSADGTIVVNLPAQSFDDVDAVFIMETEGPLKIDSVRYIGENVETNRLLAFDSNLHGKGLYYGDGKTNKYYVAGWNNKDQYLSWNFKSTTAASFKIVLKYLEDKENAGKYVIFLNNQEFKGEIQASGKSGSAVVKEIGFFKLNPGEHQLIIKPEKIKGLELMKILEIELIPIKTINRSL
ncbi:alpha-L-fucosidase [Pedobacter sp. CG_S7]|uniref:alpha-L-fucosidase n=1 Tax=Pedobacter sp. CG_S7 TaxID=3143930 RepID=UPI003392F57A